MILNIILHLIKLIFKGCNYSPWSEWSLCSALCGMNAVQQRTRVPENVAWTWCKDRLEQRICSALACKTD